MTALDYPTWRAFYPDPMDALSAGIRPAIRAPEGFTLVVVDLASIESRILGWMSQGRRILGCIDNGLDPYKELASRIFGIPYAEVSKTQRTFAKPPELGCGYQLGGPGLVAYADGMGVEMDLPTAKRIVAIWRAANPEVVNMWDWYNRAAQHATADTTHTARIEGYGVTFRRNPEFLLVDLPSGRTIHYFQPRVTQGRFGPTVTYQGRDDTGGFKGWGTIYTHGGKWTENFDQAIARDVLVSKLKTLHAAFRDTLIRIVGHVHDEVVLEVPEGLAQQILDRTVSVMSDSVDFLPGLKLAAEGYITRRYMKL